MKYILVAMAISFGCTTLTAQLPDMVLPEIKQGEQIIYLDTMLRVVSKERAYFFYYTYYHRDNDVWTLAPTWRKRKNVLVKSGVPSATMGSPVALSGTFKWFTRNYKVLLAQIQFTNGRYSGTTSLYSKKGELITEYHYFKTWNRQLWSYYIDRYIKGQLVHSAFEAFDTRQGRWKVLCTLGCQLNPELKQ
jgi:hypothetical protein